MKIERRFLLGFLCTALVLGLYPFTLQTVQAEDVGSVEIDVQGLGNSIADGDTTPSVTDDTNFGLTDIASGIVDHTFTIVNTGSATLNLTGTPEVAVGGTHAGDFSAILQPTNPVASGGVQPPSPCTLAPSQLVCVWQLSA